MTIMCVVAVRLSGVPHEIFSHSSSPARAVGPVMIRPKISASHHPWVAALLLIPVTSARAATVANV